MIGCLHNNALAHYRRRRIAAFTTKSYSTARKYVSVTEESSPRQVFACCFSSSINSSPISNTFGVQTSHLLHITLVLSKAHFHTTTQKNNVEALRSNQPSSEDSRGDNSHEFVSHLERFYLVHGNILNSRTEVLDLAPIDLLNGMDKTGIKGFPSELVSDEIKAHGLDMEFHWVNESGKTASLTSGLNIQPTVPSPRMKRRTLDDLS